MWSLPGNHPPRSTFRWRPDLTALALTVAVAGTIVAFDLGTRAQASEGVDANAAVELARQQGFEAGHAETTERYDRAARTMVWDVRGGGEHAVVDAATGELMSLDFAAVGR